MPSPSILLILATVVVNMTGVGLMWPIIPLLVAELSGGTIAQTAGIIGALSAGYALMQFLFGPLMGSLSDRFGRKPVLIAAMAGLGFDTLLMAFAPSIWWLLAGRLIGGALASTMAIANAAIADVQESSKRAAGFGLVGAAFGLGFILGPLIGGLLGHYDLRLPFFVAGGLALANCVAGIFLIRETLPPERRTAAVRRGFNPFGSLAWLMRTPALMPAAIALFLANLIQRGLEAVWVLFTQYQYGWGAREAGISIGIVGASNFLVQMLLVGRSVARFGEGRVIIAGFTISAFVYALLAFNTSGWIGMAGIVPHVIGWGIALPALQALASRAVDDRSQGYLQGALAAISGLAAVIGPAFSTATFAWFTSAAAPFHFAGAYFLAGSALFLLLAHEGRRMIARGVAR